MGDGGIRILGLAAEHIDDAENKWSGLYRALDQRFDVVGSAFVTLPAAARYALLARNFRLDRAAWSARAGFAPGAHAARTREADRLLAPWEGRYDLIVQLQTIFQPGSSTPSRRYVVYTDWTHALWCRHALTSPTSERADARRRDLEAQTAARARHVFTTSEATRRSFVEDYGCDPGHVTAVGGGANSIGPDERTRTSDGPPRALFVGYDFQRKGGDVLLAAWPEVRKRVPDAELVIAGPAPRPGSGDGISWLGPVSGREAVAELYRSATVFVLPSLVEPWGFVLHEAMGHGVPCIGVDAFAMPEIIDHGATGLLVAPGDPSDLGVALSDLLGDPERSKRMGDEARRRVLAHHLWGHVVDRMAPAIEAAVRS